MVECVFWGNGVVCVNETLELFCVTDFERLGRDEGPVVKLPDVGLDDMPHCVAVIEPRFTESESVVVLLGVGDGLVVIEDGEVHRVGEGIGPVQKMVVSRDGKMLAAFTHDGRLLILSTQDFSRIIFEHECESALPPEQLAWCGMDTVLLYWDEVLLMVGPLGEPINYYYDEPIFLISECDGVRILSNTSMEFLQRVPDSTEAIFRIGSTEPPALLIDALDHFDKRSAKADENLRELRRRKALPEAIEACVDAAGYEFDISRQRTLLRAASYGQAFCSNVPRDRFQEMCKTLRILNAVRSPDVGIPLSIQQYKVLTAPVLISRLINANHHLLALRLSEYLGLNQELVVMHWACSKITASLAIPDPALLDILLEKLKLSKNISYAAVAEHADKSGRRKLAAMLIEHEPRSSKQVPLLLSIGEEDIALTKAIESGDTDLVYMVLFHIWHKRPYLEFLGTLHARPLAQDLLIAYAQCYKHDFLKQIFTTTGQSEEVAFVLWKESWELSKNPMASKGAPLHTPRLKLIEDARKLFAESKEHNFESKAAEEHTKLLRFQHELEVKTKQAIFVDSSISDTIRTCIVIGNHKDALRVKTEFKVSEKRWYWLKVFALATIGDWDGLEKFSKEKRPPIGYKPFVEACIEHDEKNEALKYIPKLSNPREKAEAYARIGMANEAAEAASQAKDSELLGRLRMSFSQNAAAASIFDTLRDKLGVS